MKKVTVAELKEQLQEYIDILDDYDDDLEINTESNTYFVDSTYYMQFGSAGFIDLGNLEDNIDTDKDDEDEETEE